MDKKNKISVIVSAYNTESYIEKCINSLINQSYSNMEIIIVNDCSTDKTREKLVQYENIQNIKIIDNEKNMGLSYSRNIALENSSGDYIGYIDSDDYISENYYESLLGTILKYNADVVVCDMNIVYENNNQSIRTKCGDEKNNTLDFVYNGLAASACNKLFKRNVIEKYKFSEGKVNEDLAVIIPTIINNKTVYNDEVFYNYIQRNNSIQNSKITDKRYDIFFGTELTLERIKNNENYDEYKDAIVFQQLIVLLLYVFPKEKNFFKRIKWFRKFNKLIKPYNIKQNKYLIEFINSNGKKHKIYYKLLINLNCSGLYFLSSMLVSMYDFLRKILVKKVIPEDINMDDLIRLSRRQKNLKNKEYSISVVIPNYNYEKFLMQRLYSILIQKVKISEIIILDDMSTDNSREIIDEIYSNLKNYINIKTVYNEKNSGSAFKQWEKGFDLASSDYVWIAEADDYCDKDFLKNVTKPIDKNKNIVISYADTAFIDSDGNIILKSIKPEIDIMKTGHWDHDFVNDGKSEFENYSFLNCTIANVSSTLIKKGNYDEYFKISKEYKQAGDWIFYVNVMQNGYISYKNKPLNYYRVHGNNVSSVTKKEAHMNEIKNIHSYYDKKFGLTSKQKKEIDKRYDFLNEVWNLK